MARTTSSNNVKGSLKLVPAFQQLRSHACLKGEGSVQVVSVQGSFVELTWASDLYCSNWSRKSTTCFNEILADQAWFKMVCLGVSCLLLWCRVHSCLGVFVKEIRTFVIASRLKW